MTALEATGLLPPMPEGLRFSGIVLAGAVWALLLRSSSGGAAMLAVLSCLGPVDPHALLVPATTARSAEAD